ncbi:MAG TPA: phosphoribosylglycinamide synthetase C domain-containing protein [Nitrosopumilaceae archaeon]|nr:phosphoribosylglycinamide synthetase C domain-containing protein [Nitrosopumilaceae archaeon]
MKFLFVSNEALSLDLAYAIKEEGNEVKFYIQSKDEKDIGDGFVDKVDEWETIVPWADVIVFEDIGFGKISDKLRAEGKRVIGGSSYTDRLENDREFGQKELESAGVTILPSWNFSDFDEAIKFVQSNQDKYVIKPSGAAQNEKELLFVGKEADGNDIIQVLAHYKKNWSNKIRIFQLQKYAAGVEVAVGAFFDGKEFVRPININFEHKRLFPGDIGPSTGEMGTSMFWSQQNKLFEMTLEKMKPKLTESKYVGYIDINCIANGKGVFPLEFTSRFGYPTISIQMEGVTSNWGEFFYKIASGEQTELKTKKGFQVGVVVAVPPFPFNDDRTFRKYSEEATILFKKDTRDGIHIGEVKSSNGDWHIAGKSGYALVVTSSGTSMDEARKQVYNRVENVMIPNMFYRTDIGARWVSDSDMLLSWGYLY